MIAINDSSTTRTNRSTNSDTSPDVSLIHSSLAGKFTWNVLDDLGSDHKPIMITYREMNSIPTVESKPSYKWKFSDADWMTYTKEIEDAIPTNCSRKQARKLEKKIRKIMIAASNKHVGK